MTQRNQADSTSSTSEMRENVHAYFPVIKWLYGGLIAIIFAFGTAMYNVSIEASQLRQELESEKEMNKSRDRKIEETYTLMREMTKHQAELNANINSLNRTLERTLNMMNSDLNRVRDRVDTHLTNKH